MAAHCVESVGEVLPENRELWQPEVRLEQRSTPKALSAVQHIRKMRGGSQAHLMRASDGYLYVCKFANNPQHIRVLANEFLGTRLGLYLGLPMPEVAVIGVSSELIKDSPDLRMLIRGCTTECSSGLQLASRYLADRKGCEIWDYVPESMVAKLKNASDFARALVFDKWTANSDGRQAVFTKLKTERQVRATFVDQGYCFNAGDWEFPDSPWRGIYARTSVYQQVTGWESFEPALSRAEQIDCSELWKLAQGIPEEWWMRGDPEDLPRLIDQLHQRRLLIRRAITEARELSARDPFPNWIGD